MAASAGRGVLFPFLEEDMAHPAFWNLYERPVRAVLRRRLREGGVFVDVGAHRGFHSALALSLVGRAGQVVAVEPCARHAERVEALAALNPGYRLDVVRAALGREDGRADLLETAEEGWHTIVPEFARFSSAPRRPVPVPVRTLDGIWEAVVDGAGARERGAVLKVDAEGAERDVLEGGRRTLAPGSGLHTVVLECTGGPHGFERRAEECVEALRGAGWKVRVLGTRVAREWTREDLGRQVNLLAERAG